ncbi:class I SAM-dependent methyltransferase, partial [Cribrihabitans sp. XS_ASV171]
MSLRLSLALEAGLELSGPVTALLPTPDHDLSVLPGPTRVVQPFKPYFDHFQARGLACQPDLEVREGDSVLFLPRSKAQARDLVARAVRAGGTVVVDGAKTDGIDSILKEIRKRVPIEGPMSKAHGKIFWFRAEADSFGDWLADGPAMVDGFRVAPGIFSSDGIDPASAMLLSSLPEGPGKRIADLGAGWGFLAAKLLESDGVEKLYLVEADHVALTCARENVRDTRATFVWADARDWRAGETVDAVVMNPPFHAGRMADPGIGQAFVAAAARLLAPSGNLWVVANRHLPYEASLQAHFGKFEEIAGDNRFKVLHAARPTRTR